MPRIIPINQLKKSAEISSMVHEEAGPLFVTKNGYGDMVILSMQEYESMVSRLEMYQQLADAETEVKKGKVKDAEAVLAAMESKYDV